jgi:hypothetical protein
MSTRQRTDPHGNGEDAALPSARIARIEQAAEWKDRHLPMTDLA